MKVISKTYQAFMAWLQPVSDEPIEAQICIDKQRSFLNTAQKAFAPYIETSRKALKAWHNEMTTGGKNMEQVKSIKALLDAAKPFMAALPENSAMAKIVATYVDAERAASEKLVQSDANYFYKAANVFMAMGDELFDHYAELSEHCDDLPAVKVDAWDGCEDA